MATPFLQTKLHIPVPRRGFVHRQRLIEQLDAGLHRKLTLITAPAGFGKTTLISEWVHTSTGATPHFSVTWLSLDESDNEPMRFLTYLIASLQTIHANIGKSVLNALQSPQPPPVEVILTTVINEMIDIPNRFVLILDDYHLITAQPIHDALIFLLKHQPAHLHLMVASREDPPLLLARLRARDQLTELRASDLRFNSAEATEFLNQVMGLDLSAEDSDALENRTEGWIAGLQLAAISMRGHQDVASFIQSFTGSHHYVLDYLVLEVLEQQSDSIQAFLLQTAILDQMTSSLCDAVRFGIAETSPHSTEQDGQSGLTTLRSRSPVTADDSQSILEMLERTNLFIIPLDNERRWYRYHQLFADLLRMRLRQIQPELVPTLHIRASEWYEQNGSIDEAIEYAFRAEDFKRAAQMIDCVADTEWARGRYIRLQRWLDRLPVELVSSIPKFRIFRAWELFASGRQEAAQRFLRSAGMTFDPRTDLTIETEAPQKDQPSDASLMEAQGKAAAIRSWMIAYDRGDIYGLIQHLRRALEELPEDDLNWRSAAATTLGDVHAFSGDILAAYQVRLEALRACEAAGNSSFFLYNSVKLVVNLKAQGLLHEVKAICQQRLHYAMEKGISQTAVTGWLLAIWGDVLAETNDLDRSLDLVQKGTKLTENSGDVVMLGWSYQCLIRVLFSRGDLAGAERIVQKMDQVARESIVPTWIMYMNAAWQTRIWLAQGKMAAVSQWASECELETDKEPPHIKGWAYLALARVLIAQGQWEKTMTFLHHMLEASQAGGDITRVIEILLLLALAYQAGDDARQAEVMLERALTLAEPAGFIRIFVDEGPSMARLLYNALSHGIAPQYTSQLLAAFPAIEPEHIDPMATQTLKSDQMEPLSERELEVLALIAEGLTNLEIAAKLFLASNTIKTHLSNIYGKLGVHNRTQAVAKARALGLLPPT